MEYKGGKLVNGARLVVSNIEGSWNGSLDVGIRNIIEFEEFNTVKLEIKRFSTRNWPIMRWIVYGY